MGGQMELWSGLRWQRPVHGEGKMAYGNVG